MGSRDRLRVRSPGAVLSLANSRRRELGRILRLPPLPYTRRTVFRGDVGSSRGVHTGVNAGVPA